MRTEPFDLRLLERMRRGELAGAPWTIMCAGLLALAALGCGRGDDRAYSRGSTVTVLYPADERALGPLNDYPAKFMVFLPLVGRNAEGETEGQLARNLDHSPDYRTWTIHLRTDVRWHDGVPVTAHDIEFTVGLLSRPDVGYIAPGTITISVLDDSTLTYTTTGQPLSDYQTYYPKHLLENLDPTQLYDWEFWTQPVGNGPYRYVRHVPKTMMEFEINPDYVLGRPRIERVILKFGAPLLPELLSGSVDAISFIDPMELLKLLDDSRFSRYDQPSPFVQTIFWNHRHRFFREAKVRRALTLAINRRELLGVRNLPADLPLFDVIFSGRQRDSLPDHLPYDPESARRLLEEAGWVDEDGDGIRERSGERFRFDVLVAASGEREAVYVQAQLRRVGVHMDITSRADRGQVFRQVRGGDFEAAISRLVMSLSSRGGQLGFFGEDSHIGYPNQRAHQLLEMAAATQNPLTIDTLYRELMEIFQADHPVTFLYTKQSTHVVHRRLAGLSSPHRTDPVMYMEHLWLEDESAQR